MTINASLSISRLVNVTATLTAAAAQAQSTSTYLILGNSPVIDPTSRIRTYMSSTAVATDFGSGAPETLAAALFFQQAPQPTELQIGRWAQTATSGQLYGSPLSAAQQLISTWTAITDGGFHIAIDGAGAENVTGLNFTAVNNLNGVASVINAALTGAVVVWNSVYQQFIATSNTTGATSSVGFATAGSGGATDISGLLGFTQASSGSYQAPGIAAETALAAVTIFDAQFGQQWYALSILGAVDVDHLAVSAFLQGSSNKHFYGVSTQEAGVLVANSTSDIAFELKSSTVAKTAVQYNGGSPYSVASLLGRILTTDWNGNKTAITLMYKQEPGITPDNLNVNQVNALEAKNCNGFLSYNNGTAIIEPGVCSNGEFIDTAIGADTLALAVQTAVYNLLYTSPTKIPQTDSGMHLIKVTIEQVLSQFAANGFLAPGIWDAAGFGSLNQGDPLDSGYYVFAPPIATQPAPQRAQRLSVPFQIACKLAGAVQTVNVAITLNN